MRAFLVVLLCLGNLLSVEAQPLALLSDSKTWSCYGDYFFLNVKYRLSGDTLLQGDTYRKVWACTDTLPFGFDQSRASYKSAVRESSGKVWVIESGFSTPQLLYDFNKQAGDTIRFYRPIGNLNQGVLPNYVIGKVYKTDVVSIQGTFRKRLFIHDPQIVAMVPLQAYSQLDVQADVWIEGLGGRSGLFSRMPQWGIAGPQPYLLTCVEENGQLVYTHTSTGYTMHSSDPCFVVPAGGSTGGGGSGGSGGGGSGGSGGSGGGSGGSGGGNGGNDTTNTGNDSLITAQTRVLSVGPWSLFPNPASSECVVSGIEGPVWMEARSRDGRLMFSRLMYPNQRRVVFRVVDWPTGLYQLTIRNTTQIQSFRLMVNNE